MDFFTADYTVDSELIYGNQGSLKFDLSIVVPTYKRTDYLIQTLKSIKRQKNSYKFNYEVIVVSNDSNFSIENISSVLKGTNFKVYRNKKNLGMVGNMNRCAVLANGKYIAYVQDDDLLLDDYLENIVDLINSNKLDNIDCLIPNRYYYYDQSDKTSIFGEQAYKKEKKKELLKKMISIGKPCMEFQKVTTLDCARTWFNCYGGGPTCGVLFKKNSLLRTDGFSNNYPYSFDFVFFMDFSDSYNVVLYNKYLSIYRMTDSASNEPEVQKDFFDSDMVLLERTIHSSNFISLFRNEVIRFSFKNKSVEAQKIINTIPYASNNIKYTIFRVIRFVRLMRSNFYRRKLFPTDLNGII
jgi:glycosyltransferase involved in cell wall biosynthesis